MNDKKTDDVKTVQCESLRTVRQSLPVAKHARTASAIHEGPRKSVKKTDSLHHDVRGVGVVQVSASANPTTVQVYYSIGQCMVHKRYASRHQIVP